MNLGSKIQKARARLGLSQTKVGALLGVSGNTVSRWEAGLLEPTGENLHRVEAFIILADTDEKAADFKKVLDSNGMLIGTCALSMLGALGPIGMRFGGDTSGESGTSLTKSVAPQVAAGTGFAGVSVAAATGVSFAGTTLVAGLIGVPASGLIAGLVGAAGLMKGVSAVVDLFLNQGIKEGVEKDEQRSFK